MPARTPLRVFVLDNHDSFTWNLVQALAARGAEVTVARAEGDGAARLRRARADGVIVSPGPGAPEAAGVALATVQAAAAAALPLLGVCLGHQALAVAFGGRVSRAPVPRHGKTIPVHHDGRGLFAGLPDPFPAMLYHSLIVEESSLPAVLEVCARGPAGEVMALRHRSLPLAGVQFHPESIGTPAGDALLENFLASCSDRRPERTARAHADPLQSTGARSPQASAASAQRGAAERSRSDSKASEARRAGAGAAA